MRVLFVLGACERLSQHVRSLIAVAAALNAHDAVLYQIPQPMPPYCNVFRTFMELWVFRQRNRAIVIASDQDWAGLCEAQLGVEALQPASLARCFR